MRIIAAGEFKARCLKLMDEVVRTREPILITKKGKPVAQLVAPPPPAKDKFFGDLREWLEVTGDIVSPVTPPEAWEEEEI